jgi:hypothetical protein
VRRRGENEEAQLTTHRLTLVSVVFEPEFPLLQLQARSMAAFVAEDLVREIIVIDNSVRGMPADVSSQLTKCYGPLSRLVRVLRSADICRVPAASGWRSQQVLKLRVADLVTNDRYVVLDAKNHFVETLSLDFFETVDGRARVNVHGYEAHPFRPALEHVLTYLGLEPATYVRCFPATVTPFVLETEIVRAMVQDIERRSGRSFAQEFVARDLTEFFLYAGWIIANGRPLDQVYDLHQVHCPNIWPRTANLEGVQNALRAADERGTPLIAVHRKALARLDPESSRVLAGFWAKRGLFGSVQEANRFVLDFQRSYQKTVRRQRLRALSGTLRFLPQRVWRRLRRTLRRLARPA